MHIVAGIDLFAALGQPVERRNRQIKVPASTGFGIWRKKKVMSREAIWAPSTSASVMTMIFS